MAEVKRETVGEWHIDLPLSSFCVHIKKVPPNSGDDFWVDHGAYEIVFEGGISFTSDHSTDEDAIQRAAQRLRDDVCALNERLKQMTVEDIAQKLRSKANDIDDGYQRHA